MPREELIERHPVQVLTGAGLPDAERIALLERNLARLWDQVWWMQLSPEKRAQYEADGHRAPISNFYEPTE